VDEIDPAFGWLILALVLGGAELLAPGVFLIFLAIAAVATAAICFAVPDVPLAAQLGAFGVWSAIAVLIGRRWYRDYPTDTEDALLSDRGQRLIGQIVTVAEPFVDGQGRVTLGDSVWLARGAEAGVGARARVVAVEGSVLVVEPLPLP
jgi:membrane protein implicated in regulation of membrane protease activity